MPHLQVCPLRHLDAVAAASGASHLVTLMKDAAAVARPAWMPADHHLVLGLSDIVEPLDGHVLPAADHVEQLLAFVRGWGRERPLLLHCWAGISRSTAAAYISACALAPERCERVVAAKLRQASPSATPNPKLVAIADGLLGRGGRMTAAIAEIGRGADAFEGTPFVLPLR